MAVNIIIDVFLLVLNLWNTSALLCTTIIPVKTTYKKQLVQDQYNLEHTF